MMPIICGYSENVPVSVDPESPDGVTAPDIYIPDVGSETRICITWYPDDGVELEGIVGFPDTVKVSGPDAFGRFKAHYPAPDYILTYEYYIIANVFGKRVWHDPKIHNTTPTMRSKKRGSGSKKKPAKSAKAKSPAKSAKAAKPAKATKAKASKSAKSARSRR
jgi:hypothetical protein